MIKNKLIFRLFLLLLLFSCDNEDNIVLPSQQVQQLPFSLCTYNIGRFSNGLSYYSSVNKKSYEEQLINYKSIIRDINADILFLDEYNDLFCADFYGNQINASDVLFNDYNYKYISNDIDNSLYNISFFSRIKYSEVIKGYVDGEDVRYYIMTDFKINGVDVKVVNMHLKHVNGDDDAGAIKALNSLISLLSPYEKVIICGDMNMLSDMNHFSILTSAGYRIANCGAFGAFPTYLRDYPNKCVDNIAVRGLNILDVKMIETSYASDHNPLVCRLVVNE